MKAAPSKQNATAALTLPQIDALLAEITDHQLACDALRADIREKSLARDERLVPIQAAMLPELERVQAALAAVEKSLAERWQIVEDWTSAHEDDGFPHPHSLRRLHNTIGFRLTPFRVSALKTGTLGRRAWAEFRARLAAGLQITQDNGFHLDRVGRVQEGSDACGKEAR